MRLVERPSGQACRLQPAADELCVQGRQRLKPSRVGLDVPLQNSDGMLPFEFRTEPLSLRVEPLRGGGKPTERAAQVAGFDLAWEGSGPAEVGRDRRTGRILVEVDPKYYRPADVQALVGDASHARETLDWRPRMTFDELVKTMMKADLEACGAAAARWNSTS